MSALHHMPDETLILRSPTSGVIECRIDLEGIVRVSGRGLWTAHYTDTHFAALERLLRQRRPTSGGVRVLVDLRLAAVQPSDVAERIRNWTGRIYMAEDRVAILLGSPLLKAQMRRVAMIAKRELFLTEPVALHWLAG